MPDHENSPPYTGWMPPSALCSYASEDELGRFIWSHRGHDSEDESSIDSSKATLGKLLDSGLTNFDVDVVVYHGNEASSKYKKGGQYFLVSHPTSFQKFSEESSMKNIDTLQTLDEFLLQIEEHENVQRVYKAGQCGSHTAHAMIVSLEPKFYEPELLQKMVKIAQATVFRKQHTAIIAVSHDVLASIEVALGSSSSGLGEEPDLPNSQLQDILIQSGFSSGKDWGKIAAETMVGISVRTVPKPGVASHFRWDPRPRWFLDATTPPVHVKQDEGVLVENLRTRGEFDSKIGSGRSSFSSISDISFGGECVDCCSVVPHYSRNHAQIVFIDHQLLKKNEETTKEDENQQNIGGGFFHSVCERRGSHVIAWVVDDEELMWQQLGAGVGGIITNHPVSLLKSLRARYVKECQT